MDSELTYKLLKYLVQGVVIYLLFKFVPKEPMSDREIILVASIVILAYAVFENIYGMYFKTAAPQLISPAQCNAQCAIKETMTSVPAETNSAVLPQIVPAQPVDNLTASANALAEQRLADEKSYVQSSYTGGSLPVQQSQQSQQTQLNNQGLVRNTDGSYTIIPIRNAQAEAVGSRQTNGVMSMNDEMAYNYVDFNTLPVDPSSPWSQGDSMMPPTNWFPTPPHPPVCVTEKVCPVCPTFTDGVNVYLKDWDESRRITPPDNINTDFISGKLNSGR